MQIIGEFKGVKISFDLKHEDSIIKEGKYDFEFLRHGHNVYYLRLKKKGKTICVITEGERVKYKNQGSLLLLHKDPEIPDKAKLQIKKNPVLKIAYIIFESGKQNQICPFHKIRFKVEYEQ